MRMVIDVGGTHVKVLATGHKKPVKIPSGPHMTASKMVAAVRAATDGWTYEVVSMGYPGLVVQGHPIMEPYHRGHGWVRFNFKKAFHRPVKIVNDAAMQALGSYQGGQMLFLGLGTGLGSALMVDNVLAPMELAHLPYKKGRSYEDYVGQAGLDRYGKTKWRHHVNKVVRRLKAATQADYVVLAGGNARVLTKLPPGARLGQNAHAFEVLRGHTCEPSDQIGRQSDDGRGPNDDLRIECLTLGTPREEVERSEFFHVAL